MCRQIVFGIMAVVAMIFIGIFPGYAGDAVYYPGEGYIVPTEKSQAPYSPVVQRGTANKTAYSSKKITANGSAVFVTPILDQFPYVMLSVEVYDANSDPVTNLSVTDFSITETVSPDTVSVDQTIRCFTESQAMSGISYAVVFDISGSMGGQRLVDAKAAVNSFINRSSAKDKGSLVTFSGGGTAEIVVPLDWVGADADINGVRDLADAVNALTTGGSTAVFDAAGEGMDSLVTAPDPKVVVLFSDGVSNSDQRYSISQVINRAQQEQIVLYTIGLGVDSNNLRQLATETGGKYYFAPTAKDMGDIYGEIYDNFDRLITKPYHITYKSERDIADGEQHDYAVSYKGTVISGSYIANSSPQITLDSATSGMIGQSQSAGSGIVIRGTVEDVNASTINQTVSAVLYIKNISQSAYSQVNLTMTKDAAGRWQFSSFVPGSQMMFPGIEFYISATDGIDTFFLPTNFAKLPYVIPVKMNNTPVITHTATDSAVSNQPVTISASVSDTDPAQSIDTVSLYFRMHDFDQDSDYSSVVMASGDGVTYAAEIPLSLVTPSGIDYFISATDSVGTRADHGDPDAPHVIVVDGNIESAPVADAGPDQTVQGGDVVMLDGSASTDSEPDDVLAYSWEQIQGPTITLSDSSAIQPTFTAPATTGSSTTVGLVLRVIDSHCMQTTDTVYITIGDTTPSVAFTWSPAPAPKGTPITFLEQTGAVSGTIVSWAWDFGGVGQSTDQNPTFTFDDRGAYVVTLTVTDDSGTTASTSNTVQVLGSAPVVDAGGNRTVEQESEMALDGSGSYDPDPGDTLTYQWIQIAGPTVTLSDAGAAQPSFTVPAVDDEPVELTFQLTATDGDGLQSVDEVTVTVEPCSCTDDDCDADAGCFISGLHGNMNIDKSVVLRIIVVMAGLFFCWTLFSLKTYGARGMGRNRIFWFFTLILVAAISVPADGQAEIKGKSLSITPFIGGYMFDDDQNIDIAPFGGIGLEYHITPNWGVEITGKYGQSTHHYADQEACDCEEDDVAGLWGDLSGIYHFRPDAQWVPYLAAGVGYMNLDFDDVDDYSSGYVTYGGGIAYFLKPKLALRADARHIFSFDDSYNNASIWLGIAFTIGPKAEEKAPEPPPEPEPAPLPPPEPVAVVPVPEPAPAPPPLEPVIINIEFDLDKAVIAPVYYEQLAKAADYLQKSPDVNAIIEGHTCNRGSEAYNMTLSRKRAQAVKDYMISSFGIEADRLEVVPYGETRPMFDNSTKEGRKKNRRIVIQYTTPGEAN